MVPLTRRSSDLSGYHEDDRGSTGEVHHVIFRDTNYKHDTLSNYLIDAVHRSEFRLLQRETERSMWWFTPCFAADYAAAGLTTITAPAQRQLLWNISNASSPWALVAILAAGIAFLVGAVIICCGICAQMHKGSTVAPVDQSSNSQRSSNHVGMPEGAGAVVVNMDSSAALPVGVPVRQAVPYNCPASITSSIPTQPKVLTAADVKSAEHIAQQQASAACTSEAPQQARPIDSSSTELPQHSDKQQHMQEGLQQQQGIPQPAVAVALPAHDVPAPVAMPKSAPQQQQQPQQQQLQPVRQQMEQQMLKRLVQQQQEQLQQQQQQQQQLTQQQMTQLHERVMAKQQEPEQQQQQQSQQASEAATTRMPPRLLPPLPLGAIPLSALVPATASTVGNHASLLQAVMPVTAGSRPQVLSQQQQQQQ
jgi:hypothetical protein